MRTDMGGENSKQNIVTYTIGYNIDDPLLSKAAEAGGGIYFTTTGGAQLEDALEAAILNIMSDVSSGTAVSTISTSSAADPTWAT